jgi:hypothetical protein
MKKLYKKNSSSMLYAFVKTTCYKMAIDLKLYLEKHRLYIAYNVAKKARGAKLRIFIRLSSLLF